MSTSAKSAYKRQTKNFLLRPFLQLRVGIVSVGMTLIFGGLVGWYAYSKLVGLTDVIVTLTGADDSVRQLVSNYVASVGMTALAIGGVVSLLNLVVMIVLTHRLVGPSVAFGRIIDSILVGDYGTLVRLRKGDAFGDVAERFNRLSTVLKQRHRPWHNDPR